MQFLVIFLDFLCKTDRVSRGLCNVGETANFFITKTQ